MNDRELDELLDKWSAPEAPKSLRAGVRAGFQGRVKRSVRWWGKGLMATAAALALFVIATKAAPQKGRLGMLMDTVNTRHPYTVLSEYLRYAGDGSARIEMYGTSYNDKYGQEHVLARSIPDNPVHDTLARMADAFVEVTRPVGLHLLALSSHGSEMIAARTAAGPIPVVATECLGKACLSLQQYYLPKAAANPGVGCVDGPVVDHETILGYTTAAIELPLDGNGVRRTVWMAPALGCFVMKVATERQMADGSFRLVSGKQAVKVRLNP